LLLEWRGKSWHFRYCWAGKQRRMSLDINPHTERKRKRHAIVLAGEHTFMAPVSH